MIRLRFSSRCWFSKIGRVLADYHWHPLRELRVITWEVLQEWELHWAALDCTGLHWAQQVIQVVQVVRVITDQPRWWSKPSNYQEKLRCHAYNGRTNQRRRKVENRPVFCYTRNRKSLESSFFWHVLFKPFIYLKKWPFIYLKKL